MKTKKSKCCKGIFFPERKSGLQTSGAQGEHQLVKLEGPGLFLGAHVSKQGGTNNISFVDLTIDGKNVFNLSYAAMINLGFTQQNPYGLVLVNQGNITNVTLGFPYPLRFRKELILSIVIREDEVRQIIGNVIFGRK